MTVRRALATGATERDGSYLAESLLDKGYIANAVVRRGSTFDTQRIDHIYKDRHTDSARFLLRYDDQSDANSLTALISDLRATEV